MDDQQRCIFRYDNAAHHPEVPAFPHHKHEGPDERVVPGGPVDVDAILAEIRAYLSSRP